MNSVQENIPLAPLTTLGVGGDARYFAQASSEEDVLEAVGFAAGRGVGLVVLGGGSNLVVADGGFDGLVIRAAIPGTHFAGATVTAGSGVDWDGLVAECVLQDLAGVECLSGIPGWVGGTPIQNVGAYGQQVSGVISKVRVFDRRLGKTADMSGEDCRFAYRTSLFNTDAPGRYVVLSVTYTLAKGGPATVTYPDLQRVFRDRDPVTLSEVRRAVLEIRASKAMLLVDGDPDCRSAGSFFKNPIVDEAGALRVEAAAGEVVPRYPVEGNRVKLPAAWLIERAGFPKGTVRGRAGLSGKHTLALVNRGGATAGDILGLAGEILDGVEDRFGIRLRAEPNFLGFTGDVLKRFGAVSPS